MIDPAAAAAFLRQDRLAVVGVSDAAGSFGRTVWTALRDRGCDAVPVHRTLDVVDGVRCHHDLASVPGDLDGVIVMVDREHAAGVVADAIDRGVPRVWLFKGAGGKGAVSEEAVALCREHGVELIEGACPMMFLDGASWIHRVHRWARQRNGSVGKPGRARAS